MRGRDAGEGVRVHAPGRRSMAGGELWVVAGSLAALFAVGWAFLGASLYADVEDKDVLIQVLAPLRGLSCLYWLRCGRWMADGRVGCR